MPSFNDSASAASNAMFSAMKEGGQDGLAAGVAGQIHGILVGALSLQPYDEALKVYAPRLSQLAPILTCWLVCFAAPFVGGAHATRIGRISERAARAITSKAVSDWVPDFKRVFDNLIPLACTVEAEERDAAQR